MSRLDRAALAATLMLVVSPTAASAQQDLVPLTARIAICDLNRGTTAGQQQLGLRVRHAASRICSTPVDIRDWPDVLSCQTEMRRVLQVRLAALVGERRIKPAAVSRH